MAEIEIELGNDLFEGMKRLATCLYGDSNDSSIASVAESALAMRLFWLDLMKKAGSEIEEPLIHFEFTNGDPRSQLPSEIRDWLFKRK